MKLFRDWPRDAGAAHWREFTTAWKAPEAQPGLATVSAPHRRGASPPARLTCPVRRSPMARCSGPMHCTSRAAAALRSAAPDRARHPVLAPARPRVAEAPAGLSMPRSIRRSCPTRRARPRVWCAPSARRVGASCWPPRATGGSPRTVAGHLGTSSTRSSRATASRTSKASARPGRWRIDSARAPTTTWATPAPTPPSGARHAPLTFAPQATRASRNASPAARRESWSSHGPGRRVALLRTLRMHQWAKNAARVRSPAHRASFLRRGGATRRLPRLRGVFAWPLRATTS